MSHILGISAGFHDAALSVIDHEGRIQFAAHSERYSKKKNDAALAPELIKETECYDISHVAFYERPWMHNIQQWISGQRQYGPWTTKSAIKKYLGSGYNLPADISCWPHHLSHAAAGFQTSPFEEAAVVVIDAIGELDTVSIYRAQYCDGRAQYRLLWRQRYPHSVGLFYSAITGAVDLRPMEEEYITMGMAAYGRDSASKNWLKQRFVSDVDRLIFKNNLHTGINRSELPFARNEDIAAGAQGLTQELVMSIMKRAKNLTNCCNLVFMGGVALNCVVNSQLGKLFSNIWIMPNPGDAGSSLGAAALAMGKKLIWQDAFLGHNIPGEYPVMALLEQLENNQIVGVASGRAEFGPRALGNRSLLADPRGADIKNRVNDIKRRQKFRPFAPVILQEMAGKFFEMPRAWKTSDYMQTVAQCRWPDRYPAIVHVDGSSRVQTVPANGSGIRRLLEAWYQRTGCPMLLNTSLNIRGEPMVNDRIDADRFQHTYNVPVYS